MPTKPKKPATPRPPLSPEAKERGVKKRRLTTAATNAKSAAANLRTAHNMADRDAWPTLWSRLANRGGRAGRQLSYQLPIIKADAEKGCAESIAWLAEHGDTAAEALRQLDRGTPIPFNLRSKEQKEEAHGRLAAIPQT